MVFRLAHLSDLHLPAMPQPTWRELAGKRLTGYANWRLGRGNRHTNAALEAVVADIQRFPLDHIAVTGDLINLGLAGEYGPARLALERLGPPEHVALVCGNHDAYVRATSGLIERHWGPYLLAMRPRIEVRRFGHVALIGLDSAVPTPPFFATGTLGRQQREALRDILVALGKEGLTRVILIHHPPVAISRMKHLSDARGLRKILRQAGAELVLHGHTHRGTVHHIDGPEGPIPVVGVPSASMAHGAEPAGWNYITLHGQGATVAIDVERRALKGMGKRPVRIFEKRVRG